MRTIVKRKEPASLTQHRSSPGATYENYRDKDALRIHLVEEQGGLCCYCLSRVRAEPGKMKIEHWHCQDNYESEQLNYSNMLGACMGNEGKLVRDQHCDTRKGNRDLSRNPAPRRRSDPVSRRRPNFLRRFGLPCRTERGIEPESGVPSEEPQGDFGRVYECPAEDRPLAANKAGDLASGMDGRIRRRRASAVLSSYRFLAQKTIGAVTVRSAQPRITGPRVLT